MPLLVLLYLSAAVLAVYFSSTLCMDVSMIAGTYPSPKACASMVVWRDELLLFGGWSPPTPLLPHQVCTSYNTYQQYIKLFIFKQHWYLYWFACRFYITSDNIAVIIKGSANSTHSHTFVHKYFHDICIF